MVRWDVTGADDELPGSRARVGARGVARPGRLQRAAVLGAAMTYDEVVEYVLGELEQLLADPSSAPPSPTDALADPSAES